MCITEDGFSTHTLTGAEFTVDHTLCRQSEERKEPGNPISDRRLLLYGCQPFLLLFSGWWLLSVSLMLDHKVAKL